MSGARPGAAGEVRRPLGPMERWYWICDQLSPLNVVARVHLRGALPAGALDRAGAALVLENPLLRVAVAARPDGSRPRFVAAGDGRIPVRTVRADGPPCSGRWAQEVDAVELVTPLDRRSGPLARIVDVVHDPGTPEECHDLLLTVSHVIADGTTVLELLRRLVESAHDPAPGPARPALPPPEALLPRRINGLPRAAHLALAIAAEQFALLAARPWRLTPPVPLQPQHRRTRLLHRELDAGQLAALTDRCHREGTTVHGALAAALALAVAGAQAPAGTRTVCIGSPVDFRTHLVPPVGPRDAGAYVATVPTYVRVGPAAGLWAAARGVTRDLRRSVRSRRHLALVSLLRLMSPPSAARSARAVTAVDRQGPGNVCLSNLGVVDFPDRVGRWELSGAQFVAGISVSGYLVATVNTSHAALHWNFTYIDGALGAERAGRIADHAVRTLLAGLRRTETPAPTEARG
ncbi:short-chain dehydrogenase [Kitasatospora sp. NPDC008050]|uniref:phthiocerol/phthiodiolone dimycocerosyl transferase family protein n=1 Tax=Kitasatospora sp. NPDC008050 TaxID=3364021 RepID=UPI0036DFA9E4